ncbi:MAG: helix-turn-helix transcriptional regulator [Oscillospiraceae bacterium]|nr:helix-turn-helix transcriptional regulator [Oscillospiraceae bacterium]
MAQNKSLSTQEVADILHISKSTVYDLIKRGEINSYKIGRKVRFTQEDVDAYIARSRHERSTRSVKPVDTSSRLLSSERDAKRDLVISGQDVVLDILSNHLCDGGVDVGRAYLSSFEGLLALYEGRIDIASCHLYSAEFNEFNTPFVRVMVPGVPTVLVNISYRTQGFYVRKGNPKNIRGWEDLKRPDISVLNRRVGSGSRILLDGHLKKLGVDAKNVRGYERIMRSHLTMAAAIAEGEADLGLGTERVSRQLEGIDFVPLIEERYDMVLKKSELEKEAVKQLMQVLSSASFRKEISHFSGNDYRDMGKITAEV